MRVLSFRSFIWFAILSACSILPGSPDTDSAADLAAATATQPPAPPSDPTPTLDLAAFATTGLIAFTNFSENSVDIYTLDVHADEQQRLTNAAGTSIYPRWSPDGRYLSYLYFDPATDQVDIWVLDIKAGPPSRPVSQGGIGSFPELSWSPDNKYLLYAGTSTNDPSSTVIQRLDVNTGFIEVLTQSYTRWNVFPDWSPDGSRIVYVSNSPGDANSTEDIWLMDINGANQTKLVSADEPGWQESKPAWGPESWRLAFYRYPAPTADTASQTLSEGLWVISLDGTNEQLLFAYPGASFSQSPVWSPDGEWIAFTAGELDQTDVWLVRASGGQGINVSNLPGEESSVSWSPDSAWLLFTNTYQGKTSLFVAALDTSGVHPLLPGENSGYADWGP